MHLSTLTLFMLWLVSLVPALKAKTIDDFQCQGQSNKLGFLRRSSNTNGWSKGSLSLGPNDSLLERLTKRSGRINLTGKAMRLSYSASTEGVWTLHLRLGYGQRMIMSNPVYLQLKLGGRKKITIPMDKFVGAKLSKVTGIVIKGMMVLYKVEIIDDINLNQLASAVPAFPSVAPVLTIDDFSPSLKFQHNNLEQRRHVSGAFSIDVESVHLRESTDSMCEIIASNDKPMDLQYLSVRIVYSKPTTGTCFLGLLHQTGPGMEQKVSKQSVEYPAGQRLAKIVPISTLLESDKQQCGPIKGTGIMIYGPLEIHRIELIAEPFDISSIVLPTANRSAHDQRSALFVHKAQYFTNALQLIRIPKRFELGVDIENVLLTTFKAMDVASFRMDLEVYFHYELRKDRIQPMRRLFNHLSMDIVDPANLLFRTASGFKRSLLINPNSNPDASLLEMYKFVGRIIGMGILNREMQYTSFVPTVYRILLNRPLLIDDMDHIDPTLQSKIKASYLFINKDATPLTMSLTHTDIVSKETFTVDLVPNGQNILVTDYNFLEYSTALCSWHFDHYIGVQAQALRDGFYSVIPKELVALFDEIELEHFMAGCPGGHEYLPRLDVFQSRL